LDNRGSGEAARPGDGGNRPAIVSGKGANAGVTKAQNGARARQQSQSGEQANNLGNGDAVRSGNSGGSRPAIVSGNGSNGDATTAQNGMRAGQQSRPGNRANNGGQGDAGSADKNASNRPAILSSAVADGGPKQGQSGAAAQSRSADRASNRSGTGNPAASGATANGAAAASILVPNSDAGNGQGGTPPRSFEQASTRGAESARDSGVDSVTERAVAGGEPAPRAESAVASPGGQQLPRPSFDQVSNADAGGGVPVAAIPEPGTYAMMLFGLALVGLAVRRSRRRR
jgi:hypothetical protein